VEAKTGYHCARGELESTRILSRLGERADLPRIEVTFIARHRASPRPRRKLGSTRRRSQPGVLTRTRRRSFCDVFCDQGYFSVVNRRHILKAASPRS